MLGARSFGSVTFVWLSHSDRKIAGSDDRWGDRRHVHDRSDRPDRERRDRDEDMGPSRADSADAWRRNGPGADSRDDRGPRRDRPFGNDDRPCTF